jgi:heptose-I-phosphate ethanolaminephosphotransferase
MRTNVLRNNENQFFTNDMLYDTVCGILNAVSNHYDTGQDFSSLQYRFNLQNLTTMLGQKKLTEDPYLNN